MSIVWMYQHPSNGETWKEYSPEDVHLLETAYQRYRYQHGEHFVELIVNENVVVAVDFRDPMFQNSTQNNI